MNVAGRLGAFAAAMALTFGGGLALGAAIGPDASTPPPTHGDGHGEGPAPTTAPTGHTTHQPATQGSEP